MPLNVYQLMLAMPGPLLVRRDSWSSGVAEVLGSVPDPADWDREAAPYFGNPTVFALVKYRATTPYELIALSGPGTYAYTRLEVAPPWWRQNIRYPVKGYHKPYRLELDENGLRVVSGLSGGGASAT